MAVVLGNAGGGGGGGSYSPLKSQPGNVNYALGGGLNPSDFADTSAPASGYTGSVYTGDLGGYSPPPPSTGIPSLGGNLPKVSYGSERGSSISPQAFSSLSGSSAGRDIPSLPPYQSPSLGGGSGGGSGGGVGRGSAIQQMISGMATSQADAKQRELADWQFSQQKNQAAYDKQAIGRLGGGYESMIENYNKAFGAATEGNEARYQQMLGIADQTTDQRLADVSSAYNQRGSDIQQKLASLGMANTTVAPTMQFGVDRERQSALNRTADEMQQTKLGLIASKDDNYPDLGSLQSIIGATGSAFGTRGIDAMLAAFGNVRSV